MRRGYHTYVLPNRVEGVKMEIGEAATHLPPPFDSGTHIAAAARNVAHLQLVICADTPNGITRLQ